MSIATFFLHDQFVIDEKVSAFKLTNAYRVYDAWGQQIGGIQQHKSGGQKALGMLIGGKLLPWQYTIDDEAGNPLVTVKKGATLMLSNISVLDAAGNVIAGIQQKWSFMKPKFTLVDAGGVVIGTIAGDWKGWNFSISDANGREIGTINKRWAGAMKEIFTTADKYIVTINPEVTEDQHKVAIVAAAVTIDMVLKENK
ncbi:MAG: hypothetical protein LBH11_06435 [Propionibacteriaceae bacterium]|jgi:uncharacterized protein YxjI|nr:hypothetical protein [Propionibacteriaceae bacterium]